jgi:hypothetical protein
MDEAASVAMVFRRMINGYQLSQAIHVAATLGIADLIDGEPRDVDDLAAEADAHAPSLYRLMRALAAEGVFREVSGRRFAHSELSELLRSNAAASLAGWAKLVGRPYFWEAWSHLQHSIRTGENAFAALHGQDVWDYRSQRPEENAVFNDAMASFARASTKALLDAYDFTPFSRIADIGGGSASLLSAVLRAHPSARGVLFDQPHVVSGARAVLQDAGVLDRCEVVGGSFFDAVPEADAYLVRAILHDWSDAEATRILAVVRRAAPAGARLLVYEQLIGAPNDGAAAKFSDLNMLVLPGGQERTKDAFATLFSAGGWRLERVYPAGPAFVLEGTPA